VSLFKKSIQEKQRGTLEHWTELE